MFFKAVRGQGEQENSLERAALVLTLLSETLAEMSLSDLSALSRLTALDQKPPSCANPVDDAQ